MMKSLKLLVKSFWNYSVGNHSVTVDGDKRYFRYHGNIVCKVNDDAKTFVLDDCGYSGYSSTTRTLNDYRKYFSDIGYIEI